MAVDHRFSGGADDFRIQLFAISLPWACDAGLLDMAAKTVKLYELCCKEDNRVNLAAGETELLESFGLDLTHRQSLHSCS